MEKCFIQMRAYNDEKTIKRAIDSVLMQDYPNVERLLRKRFAAPMKTITFFLWTVTIFIPEGTPFPEP